VSVIQSVLKHKVVELGVGSISSESRSIIRPDISGEVMSLLSGVLRIRLVFHFISTPLVFVFVLKLVELLIRLQYPLEYGA
jgi:hypothetical protein